MALSVVRVAVVAGGAAVLTLASCGGQPTAGPQTRDVDARTAGAAEVQREAGAALEAKAPLLGAAPSQTFCAVELGAADGALDARDGRVVRAWGWASCQQLMPAAGGRLRGGSQLGEPIRVVLHRDGAQLRIDAIDVPPHGLDYERAMRELFPERARTRTDRLPAAQFDARIDRLLCANLAAAGERYRRPGAELVRQGERCPA